MLFPGLPARIMLWSELCPAYVYDLPCAGLGRIYDQIYFFHGRPYCSWNLPWGTAMWTAFSGCTVPSNFGYTMILLFHNSRLAVLPSCRICTGFTFLARVCLCFCLPACLLVLFRVVSLLCADRVSALFEAHAPLAMPVPFLGCSRFILFTQSCLMQTCARRGSLLRGKKNGVATPPSSTLKPVSLVGDPWSASDAARARAFAGASFEVSSGHGRPGTGTGWLLLPEAVVFTARSATCRAQSRASCLAVTCVPLVTSLRFVSS